MKHSRKRIKLVMMCLKLTVLYGERPQPRGLEVATVAEIDNSQVTNRKSLSSGFI